ncbi:MAG: hypothetical protein ACLQEQ_03185 [Nitrososphaerales archaeon]
MPQTGFAEALFGENEIQLTVVRKRDGSKRTLPVWFSVHGSKLELLPMHGLKTRWFMDLERNGEMEVKAKDKSQITSPVIVLDSAAVEAIKRRFGVKYGPGEVRKYYPTSEVALEIGL